MRKSTLIMTVFRRMVDVTPEKGAGFEHWAKVFNLKQSAESLAELEEYGFKSLEDLQTALAMAKMGGQRLPRKAQSCRD